MVSITLKDGQNGYDEVGRYIERFWDHHITDTVICRIGTSYDGNSYEIRNEAVCPTMDGMEFLYDWWEGERFITIYGIISLNDVDVNGGLYEK